jgi:hypothetical protein
MVDTSTDTKRARRLAARAERQRIAEQGRRRAKTRRRITVAGLILAAVAVLALGGWMLAQNLSQPSLGVLVPDEGRDHVSPGTPLTFRANPPSSGTHYGSWTRPGLYTEAQDPGNWVHSLEHGYVVILYNCPSGCPETVAQLRDLYSSAPKSNKYNYQKLVITPYTDMENQITAVAWGRKMELDGFDRQALSEFYRAYLDRGPEDAG